MASLCADRVEEDAPRTPREQLAWVRSQASGARLSEVMLSGAACSAWPVPAGPRPPSLLPAGLRAPVILMTSTADPITPPAITRRLAERYGATADVYRIVTTDGPHVTFARGNPCPDDPIVRLLVEGVAPARVTHCGGRLVTSFAPVVRRSTDLDGLWLRAYALDDEIYYHPDYQGWYGYGQLSLGCRYGGTATVDEADDGYKLGFQACEVREGEPLTGTGRYRWDGSVLAGGFVPERELPVRQRIRR